MTKKIMLIILIFSFILLMEWMIIDHLFAKEARLLVDYDPLVQTLNTYKTTEEMEDFLSSFSNVEEVTIQLLEPNGEVLYSSDWELNNPFTRNRQGNVYEVRRDELKDHDLMLLIIKHESKQGILKYGFKNMIVKIIMALLTTLLLISILRQENRTNLRPEHRQVQSLLQGEREKRIQANRELFFPPLTEDLNKLSQKLDQEAKEQFLEEKEYFTLLGGLESGILTVDSQEKAIRFNEVAEKLLHLNPRETLGRELDSLLDNKILLEKIREAMLKSTHEQSIELELYNRDIEIHAHRIIAGQKLLGYALEFKDVTEAKRLDQVRRDFVSNVSHELKTPITSIKGFTETLLDHSVDPEHTKHFLSIIHTEVERMEQLIGDLFVLTETEKIEQDDKKKKHFSPYDELEEIMIIIQGLREKYPLIELTWKTDASHHTIFGNPYSFRQMVLNLLVNAMKYSKEEGGIVEIRAYNKGKYFFLEVRDEGIGIDEKDIPRIFERFFRAERSRSTDIEGTGLGLAIVKHIVLGFGGHIRVKSKRGEGSQFIVKIPSRDLHGINL